jgi:hypothetical protein
VRPAIGGKSLADGTPGLLLAPTDTDRSADDGGGVTPRGVGLMARATLEPGGRITGPSRLMGETSRRCISWQDTFRQPLPRAKKGVLFLEKKVDSFEPNPQW